VPGLGYCPYKGEGKDPVQNKVTKVVRPPTLPRRIGLMRQIEDKPGPQNRGKPAVEMKNCFGVGQIVLCVG